MPLVSSSIPNLINGISQQPPEIRLSSQSERQVNGFSTVARGLEKRPGTEHNQKITSTLVDDTFVHTIRRDRNEEYTMVLTRASGTDSSVRAKNLTIYDQEGVSVPIKTEPVADASAALHAVETADLVYLDTLTNAGGVNDNIVATTVADTTFLINKTKTVLEATGDYSGGKISGEGTTSATSPAGSSQLANGHIAEGLIYVKSGDYSSKYVIKIEILASNGAVERTYKVGLQTPASTVAVNQQHIATSLIAKYLKEGQSTSGFSTGSGHGWDNFTSTAPVEGFGGWRCIVDRDENGEATGAGDYVAGLDAIVSAEHAISANSFKVDYDSSGSVLKLRCFSNFTIEVQDSKAGGALIGIRSEVLSFKDLPGKNVPIDFIVKVVGNAGGSQDDFYVKYEESDDGVGVWKETLAPSIDTGFDVTTMPHRLIRLYDDSGDKYFLYETVKEVAAVGTYGARFGWSSRKSGDDTSNPFPTFTGGKINDILFHKNRFGILSDENIIFSEAGNYYNFFPISVMTALDGNPIDISVSNNEVSILTHAAAFNQGLLLFSDFQQFSLNSEGEGFTPATVSVNVVTQFESTSKAPPVSSGKFVYFPFERGEYSGVREYFVDMGTADSNDATDITSHVPQYIKGNVTKMVVSSNEQMLAILSSDDPKRIYVYKNFWQGQDKLQNSWSHWTFDGDILNCAFLGSTLKLLVKRSDGLYLEDINLSLDSAEAVMEDDTAVLLDRRVKLTYNQTVAANLPYTAPSNIVYVTDNARKLTTTAQVNEYLANGRTLADGSSLATSKIAVYAGIPYTFEYEFSRFIHKENELPVQTAKLQIRNINLLYNRTGFFNLKINVDPGTIKINAGNNTTETITPRTNYEKTFSGMISNTSSFGEYKLLSGTFKGGVMSKASNCNIVIENDEYLPCSFQSAEWEGFLHLRSQRV